MKKILLLALLTAGLSVAARAQATLEITVADGKTDVALPGIPVIVTNDALGFRTKQATDTRGKVRLSGLATGGSYTVTVPDNALYYEVVAADLTLRNNASRSVSLLLPSKQTFELDEVVIGNPTTRINTVNAEVAAELTARELQELPVEGRDITRALYRLPNVVRSTGFYPEAPNISINGANPLYTNYLIDGMDNIERFLGGQRFALPVGFAQNLAVLTNNYSAEYGWSSNGVVDITTKAGSNDWRGELFYVTRPGAVLDANTEFAQTDLTGNPVKEGFQRHQFGFGVGGPIQKDKTFFFLNAEQTFDLKDNLLSVPALGVNETVRGENRFTLLSGKIEHRWTDRFRSSVRAHGGLVSVDRQGGGLDGGVVFPEAGNRQERNSFVVANQNVYRGRGFTSETNYQYAQFDWLYLNPNTVGVPSVTALGPDGTPVAVLGETLGNFDLLQRSHQVQQKFTWTRGRHQFKTGAEVISTGHTDTRGGNGNGFYQVRLTDDQLAGLREQNLGTALSFRDLPADVAVDFNAVELRPGTFEGRQTLYSVYFEDLVALHPRLNLTLGLRYDYDDLTAAGRDRGDLNNLAPRANLNYRLTDRSSLRAGYGLFYGRIIYAVYSDALALSSESPDVRRQLQALVDAGIMPQDTDLGAITTEGNATAVQTGVGYLQGATSEDFEAADGFGFTNEVRVLNPDGWDSPYSHQFTLGYQHQLAPQWLFYTDAMVNLGYNRFRLRDLNAPAPYVLDNPFADSTDVRSVADADATRPVPIRYDDSGNPFVLLDGDTLRNVARRVTTTEAAGRSRYVGVNFNLVKERGDDSYSLRASYTLSRLTNDTEDINFEAADANDFDAEWAPSLNDRTHVLSVFGTYYPLEDFGRSLAPAYRNLGVTVAALVQSGQPANRVPDAARFGGLTDLNGDGGSFATQYTGKTDRQPGANRNDRRLPWNYLFDVGVHYTVPLYRATRLELRADVFNIFNLTNYSGYTSNATQSNQIQVGLVDRDDFTYRNAGPPRQFQFSARLLL